jgi:hypothetical protein
MRIFVSSTYRQLASYREVMRLAIEKSGHTFLGMEYFSAQDAPPLNVCLQELETADVYVGVLGTIYGSSPPGQDLSYTELEYNRARELSLPCIILLISEEALIPVGTLDSDPNRNGKLRNFINLVMVNHTIDRFCNEHEAAWKVLAGLRVQETRRREDAN